jgi:hypothetical protein
MTELVEINKNVSIFPYETDKTIELDTFDKDANCNYLTVAEARKLAANLITMADKIDPEGREKYLVDAYTLDVYKREADEAATEASRIHLFADSEREYQEAYQAKLAEIGQWILGYSKEGIK